MTKNNNNNKEHQINQKKGIKEKNLKHKRKLIMRFSMLYIAIVENKLN